MNNILPCNDKNSIDKVAFILTFLEPINDSMINQAINLHQTNRKIFDELPRMQLQNTLTLQVGEQVQFTPNSPLALGGVIFDKVLPDGKSEWFINISNGSIIIGNGKYTRWDNIWEQAKNYILAFSSIFQGLTLASVSIEYVDIFTINTPTGNQWKNELFNQNSKLLPKSIWELDDFWHVHQGHFINKTYKILNNINVNYSREDFGQQYKVVLSTQHRAILNSPITLSEDDTLVKEVEIYMQANHLLNKEVLCDLLSTDMCDKLNLRCSHV